MTDFFTSDTHFAHSNIIAYCKRPFASVEEMNAEMIRRWNSIVTPDDTVYFLGDFAMGPKDKWRGYREQLNGRIVFVMGNHDAPVEKFDAMMGPDDIAFDEYLYDRQGVVLHLAHFPVGGDPDRGYARPSVYASQDIYYYLCGHVHDAWKVQGNCINVGVDVWNFTPRTLEEIIA